MESIVASITIKNENFLSLKFSFDEDLISRVKQISRAHWNKELKCWLVPDLAGAKSRVEQLF